MEWKRIPGLLVLAAVAGCNVSSPRETAAGADSSGGSGGTPVELDPVTLELQRTRAAELQSRDGVVTIYVPAQAVETEATLRLARLADERAPNPRVGAAYVLHVDGGTLQAPVRVRWRVRADTSVPPGELRVATLDGSGALVALASPQITSDEVAAQLAEPAVLVLVDRRAVAEVPTSFSPDVPATSAGDALLWRADVEGARAAYHAARSRGPSPQASLGRAVTDLVLMTRQPPVGDVLLRCGLPAESLLDAMVGAGGVLEQAAEDRAGDGWVNVADASGALRVLADEVYVRQAGGGWRAVLRGRGVEVHVEVPPGPASGTVSAREFGGTLKVYSGGDVFSWEGDAPGSLAITRPAGTADALRLEWSGVVVTGAPGTLEVGGQLVDHATDAPTLSGHLQETTGMPADPARAWAWLAGQCSADVTEAWLRERAGQDLAARLEMIATDLSEAGAAPGDATLLELPAGLTRLPRALALTARDARALGAGVHGLASVLLAARNFRLLGGQADGGSAPVSSLVTARAVHAWTADGGIGTQTVPAWDLDALEAGLNEQLMTPVSSDGGMEGARAAALAAVAEARAAVASVGVDGVVRWSVLDEGGWSTRLRVLADGVAATLPAQSAAVALGTDGGFSLHAGRALDAPPDHADLVEANASEPLFQVFPGQPAGRTPAARNPVLLVNDHGVTNVGWNLVLSAPPAASEVCSGPLDSVCGPGWACVPVNVGSCEQSADACLSDDTCPLPGDACGVVHGCRRGSPPALELNGLAELFRGPTPAALAHGAWLLAQPLMGRDPAVPPPAN